MAKYSTWKATRCATNAAAKAAEKVIPALGRWAVTDHSGTAKLLANLPPMGMMDTLTTLLVTVMLYLLVAVGIPLLLGRTC